MRRAWLALVVLLAGCGGGGAEVQAQLAVVVPDNNIRGEGEECSGATPFRAIHRGTAFTIEDASGEQVADGELPAGRAANADPTIDWEAERFPTVCVFDVEVGLPERQRYRLVLPDATALEFERRLLDRDEPLRLILVG